MKCQISGSIVLVSFITASYIIKKIRWREGVGWSLTVLLRPTSLPPVLGQNI